MEEALRDYLLTNSALVTLIGSKIRWGVSSPDDAGSRIVLTTISRQPVYHTTGQSDLADARVQVDCYAEKALTALQIARAVKAAIPKSQFTAGGVTFSITQISERQSYEDPTASHRVHRVSIDFRAWHTSP
jgi:hypothetical protein